MMALSDGNMWILGGPLQDSILQLAIFRHALVVAVHRTPHPTRTVADCSRAPGACPQYRAATKFGGALLALLPSMNQVGWVVRSFWMLHHSQKVVRSYSCFHVLHSRRPNHPQHQRAALNLGLAAIPCPISILLPASMLHSTISGSQPCIHSRRQRWPDECMLRRRPELLWLRESHLPSRVKWAVKRRSHQAQRR